MPIQAFYQTRRGAHVVETIISEARALHLVTKVRGDVRIEKDGEAVGGRERFDGADDKRIRWLWWLDQAAFKS